MTPALRLPLTPLGPGDPMQPTESGRRFRDPRTGIANIRLMPGEFYVTSGDELLTTVLGSCIAVCAWDPALGVGGMNHFMLPVPARTPDRWQGTLVDPGARYGSVAMERLLNALLERGARRNRLELKAFGGGRVVPRMGDVGARNIEFLRGYVRTEGLRVVAQDLGGEQPRRVEFSPALGRVRIKRLRSSAQVAAVESRYQAALPSREGMVEIFEP